MSFYDRKQAREPYDPVGYLKGVFRFTATWALILAAITAIVVGLAIAWPLYDGWARAHEKTLLLSLAGGAVGLALHMLGRIAATLEAIRFMLYEHSRRTGLFGPD